MYKEWEKIIQMAVRNIKRNKRRTVLSIISVGLSIMLVVVLQGLVDGLVENIIKNSIKNETGHIRITTKKYFEEINSPSSQQIVYNPESVLGYILSDVNVSMKIEFVTERIKFPVLLQYSGNNKTAVCIAGDSEKEKKLLMLDKSIIEGEYLRNKLVVKGNKKYREIIIGKKLAKMLNLKVGDTFPLMLSGIDFGVRIPSFYVRGIFETGLNMFDENVFMMNIEDAKYVLRTNGGVHEILIMIKKYKEAEKVAKYINSLLLKKDEYKNLVASDWKTTGGFVKMMYQALKIYNFLYIAITFLGSFIITNIILMTILERKREIGILKSMGFKKVQILMLFTFEGMVLGTVGSICGALLGILISIPLSIYGIDFSSSMSNMNFPMDNIVRWSINLASILSSVLLGILVSSIVSVLPSRYASKMKTVDALKSV